MFLMSNGIIFQLEVRKPFAKFASRPYQILTTGCYILITGSLGKIFQLGPADLDGQFFIKLVELLSNVETFPTNL